jgi:nicotinamidase-related amidase
MTIYHRQFLSYLKQWVEGLPPVLLSEICPKPKNTAIISVDVINGFCSEGPLSSPRIKKIVNPITKLFSLSWEYGIKNIVLTQDTHEPDAVEFGSFPPHCVRGTSEAETVPEFQELPFFTQMIIMEKNSIHSGIDTGLMEWMAEHPKVEDYLVVGDCTDLCVYQLAMHLRLDANARQKNRRVIIPAECVDTYDMSVTTAAKFGAMPHDAELLHAIFLYHMALNGVLIVKSIH